MNKTIDTKQDQVTTRNPTGRKIDRDCNYQDNYYGDQVCRDTTKH